MSDTDITLAAQAVASGITPKGITAQQAYLSILAGRDLGLAPMQAMRMVFVVEGRITLSAQAMGGCVQRAGGSIHWHEMSADAADVEIVLPCLTPGMPPSRGRVRWTMEDARRAGLASRGTWRSYPAAMLANRALAQCARAVAPATFMGVYLPDEVEADEVPVEVSTRAATPRAVPGLAPARQIEAPPPAVLDAIQPIEIPEWATGPAVLTAEQRAHVLAALAAEGVPVDRAAQRNGTPETWSGATAAAILMRLVQRRGEIAQRRTAQQAATAEPQGAAVGDEE